MDEKIREIEPSAKQKQYDIADHPVGKVAQRNQSQRKFYILRIKDPAEFPVQKTDVHVKQSVEPDHIAKKNIDKQPTDKSRENALFLSPHKTDGSCGDDQQVRTDPAEIQPLKQGALQ